MSHDYRADCCCADCLSEDVAEPVRADRKLLTISTEELDQIQRRFEIKALGRDRTKRNEGLELCAAYRELLAHIENLPKRLRYEASFHAGNNRAVDEMARSVFLKCADIAEGKL